MLLQRDVLQHITGAIQDMFLHMLVSSRFINPLRREMVIPMYGVCTMTGIGALVNTTDCQKLRVGRLLGVIKTVQLLQ